MIYVFYHQKQSAVENISFSPSAEKPKRVIESWKKLGIPFKIQSIEPVTKEQLYKVHDKNYVDEVLSLQRVNGFGNYLKSVADALPYVSGSMVASVLHVVKEGGIAFSPTSGAHHAGYDFGGGFCTFNFLALSALIAYESGVQKIGIIDMDCHHGNGTVDIINRLKMDFVTHYSFSKEIIKGVDLWLSELEEDLDSKFSGCDLIIYNAGVDSHVNDPLGGYLTTEEMAIRDEIVFNLYVKYKIPIAVSLAGGYQKINGDISPVLCLHDATFKKAFEALFK